MVIQINTLHMYLVNDFFGVWLSFHTAIGTKFDGKNYEKWFHEGRELGLVTYHVACGHTCDTSCYTKGISLIILRGRLVCMILFSILAI